MSAASFTPGPWEAQRVPEYHVAGDTITFDPSAPPSAWAIRHVFKRENGGRVTQYIGQAFIMPDRDAEANARLIAAAPELYGLAERAMRWFADNGCAGELAWEIGETLAKARGEAA